MNKSLSVWIMLCVILGCFVAFTSCGSDKDDEAPTASAYNGHKYVDLGLSVKWATCNVGANSPEKIGDYFAWGETSPKNYYAWSTYKWCNGSNDSFIKYCTNPEYGTVDGIGALAMQDDAAHVIWGGNWRMPTKAEMDELRTQCSWSWTTLGGVNGYVVLASNGNSIFLPATGAYIDGEISKGNYDYAGYWTCTLSNKPFSAYICNFSKMRIDSDWGVRSLGLCIRPVAK